MDSSGSPPTFRTSVTIFSSSSRSRIPPLTSTTSPSLTPALWLTSFVARACRSVGTVVFGASVFAELAVEAELLPAVLLDCGVGTWHAPTKQTTRKAVILIFILKNSPLVLCVVAISARATDRAAHPVSLITFDCEEYRAKGAGNEIKFHC